jgi:vacuolar-type H+-ATPase subunit E/Vma4
LSNLKVFFPSSAASTSTSIANSNANANAALKVLASQAKAVDGTRLAFDEVVDKRSIGSGNVG